MNREVADGWIGLLSAILRGRVITARIVVTLVVLVGASTLARPRSYSSSAGFLPQGSASAMSRFAGLAAQFGLSAPLASLGNSPDFYAELIRSDQILRTIVQSRFQATEKESTVTQTLVEIYDIEATSESRRVAKAVTRLRRNLTVKTDPKTSVVKFTVRSLDPELSKAIADRLLEEVNQFNLQSRQTQAGEERRFVEGRLDAAREELRASENRLEAFMVRNREYRNSPQLAFEYERLQRDLSMQQQMYSTLAQSYEQARIEEVRNTPVITLVETPVIAPLPDRRFLVIRVALAVVVGGLAGIVLSLFGDILRMGPSLQPAGAVRFVQLWDATKRDLRRPWRILLGSPEPPEAEASASSLVPGGGTGDGTRGQG